MSYHPLNYPPVLQSPTSSTLFDSEIPFWERIRSGSQRPNTHEINVATFTYLHAPLLALLFCCLVKSTFGQDESVPATQPSNAAELTHGSPHPWIDTAPPGFARLISLGRVQIKIDDQRLDDARKQALTHFKIKADYRYLYTQQSTRVDPKMTAVTSRRSMLELRYPRSRSYTTSRFAPDSNREIHGNRH